jgi:ABC-type iron transport system FetAB permease component
MTGLLLAGIDPASAHRRRILIATPRAIASLTAINCGSRGLGQLS